MNARHSSESTGLSIPIQHGQKLIAPPMEQVAAWIRASRLEATSSRHGHADLPDLDFCGIGLESLRHAARRSVVELAVRYTSLYRTVSSSVAEARVKKPRISVQGELSCAGSESSQLESVSDLAQRPIVMGGHQPDLFHCGVWFKNFLLSDIAKTTGAIAIHFLVDNDLCRSTGIRAPVSVATSGGTRMWRDRSVFYDSPRDPIPWENCYLKEPTLWNSFPDQVRKQMPVMRGEPLVDRLWEYSKSEAKIGAPLGYLLSRSRHRLEADLGLMTLEVPLSQLVSTPEFARFSLHLLNELPRLHEIYNSELAQYRKSHRIRNHAQPLPDLDRVDQWFETPWWYYPAGSPVRFPLWACRHGDDLILTNRQDWKVTISKPAGCDAAMDQWLGVLSAGVCLRPRALLTTMYARLICSDLFVHGMGGARYDQLTDRIIQRFFGIRPPPVVQATATLHLPLEDVAVEFLEPSDQKVAALQQQLREFQSNPEAGLRLGANAMSTGLQEELQLLRMERESLLSNIPPKGEKWEWHTKMKRLNDKLSELAKPSVEKIQAELNHLLSIQQQRSTVLSREFSFCLFPLETIIEGLQGQ